MSFTTPTNSILNRDDGQAALVSQIIYENESLKIQVETLQEKLQSTGLLKLDDLRQENEALRGEVATLRVQLEEKTAQLNHYKTSGDRFSNIDQSLHELLTQIQTQRAEMTEMKDLTREKDARIAELTSQVQHAEEDLNEANARAAAAAAASAQQGASTTECDRLREQLAQVQTEMDTLRRASEQEAAELQNHLSSARAELLALKEDAAAKSRAKGERVTSQEQVLAECREREASSQRQVVELQARVEMLKTECSQLRETHADFVSKQLQQQHEQATVAVVASNNRVDLYCPEVKAHVEKAVQRATEGVERRLQEQVEQNASLLSRMALVQQESEAMLKTKGMSNHEVTVMKERVDLMSRRKDARNTMQRRVAELLSNEELSKEDIELLLQEMLDYQEEQDQENRTLLLIKDMEAEERERVLRRELKRVNDENASLMKQLQQLALEGFHRARASSLPGDHEPSPRVPDNAPPAASAHPTTSEPPPPATAAATRPEPSYAIPAPAYAAVSEPRWQDPPCPSYPGAHTASAAPPQTQQQQQHPPQQQQHPRPQFGGDLWSDAPSRQTPAHEHPQPTYAQPTYAQPSPGRVDPMHFPQQQQQQQQQQPPPQPYQYHPSQYNVGGTSPEANRNNTMVHCPACTFEQRYGNRKCEICDAVLQLK